jgi:AraC family transcriptional regulator of adaptative response/methylated-DNA-[protein]-cysteine methyltransferase
MHEEEYWQAVCDRNSQYDDLFIVAVRSTGIYCLPSCPSRQPRRENVLFFPHPKAAKKAGFRACKRCNPDRILPNEPYLDLIKQVALTISENTDFPPTLSQLANEFNFSRYHLQRTFKRLVGVSPKQYAEACRLDRFKKQLKQGETVTKALYSAGYSSISSLYERASEQLGMTPITYQNGGSAMQISYAVVPCSLGYLLVASTQKGICAVKLGDRADSLETDLQKEFSGAALLQDNDSRQNSIEQILNFLSGNEPHLDLPLDIRGTAFQQQVWQALQKIPYGETRTYQEIARAIGKPKAVRAVGGACGANPVALIVPCHRVLKSDGGLGGYAWGSDRKETLLKQEGRRQDQGEKPRN